MRFTEILFWKILTAPYCSFCAGAVGVRTVSYPKSEKTIRGFLMQRFLNARN